MFGHTGPFAAKSHATPSLEESRRQVQESLDRQAQEVDHDAILAGLQGEIDKHNAIKNDAKETMRRSKRSREHDDSEQSERRTKFRFKDGEEIPRKRRHRHRRRDTPDPAYPTPPSEEAAHPFPREPSQQPLDAPPSTSADAAFRTSLFDALADDEGAEYWSSVYAQPIHVYDRPLTESAKGELEAMDDEQYAAYVKTRMWEKKHPEIMLERKRSAKKKKEEEEARTRRREEFLRRREQRAWDRAERKGARSHRSGTPDPNSREKGYHYEYAFAGERNSYADALRNAPRRSEYEAAWKQYLASWDRLKLELLDERVAPPTQPIAPSKRIPWPVLETKPVVKANIEAFMQHAPTDDEKTKLQSLKAERVRWHPDKIQQRFAGAVDEGTMRLVTGVFQVVDGLFEEERKRGG